MARARSLSEFQTSFPDERSCAAFLFERRWPQGFVCPRPLITKDRPDRFAGRRIPAGEIEGSGANSRHEQKAPRLRHGELKPQARHSRPQARLDPECPDVPV